MWPTLFHIQFEPWGWPMFGFGWLLAAWLLFGVAWMIGLGVRQGWHGETRSWLWLIGFVGLVIALADFMVERDHAGRRLGLPIRGYGTMVLAGVVCGLSLAVYRAQRRGLPSELMTALLMWMFVGGIGGARLFFVAENWEMMRRPTLGETLMEVFRFTEGGLVVYGSLFGGLAAALLFVSRRRLPMLAIGDLVAPCLALGLSLGRIGCLLNGCCWGGSCDGHAPGLCARFPFASPAYMSQLERGELAGLKLQGTPRTVSSVVEGSPAAGKGLQVGDRIDAIGTAPLDRRRPREEQSDVVALSVLTADGRSFDWEAGQLPDRSLPVHLAQVYSAIDAALICLVAIAAGPFFSRDGQTLALTLTLYGLLRFLEERIRDDQPGILGTSLTISQWISIGMLVGVGGLWLLVQSQPKGTLLPTGHDAEQRGRVARRTAT